MTTNMNVSPPSDEASHFTVNPISTFPTIETIEEIMDIFLTWKIWEYSEDKLIDDYNLFAMLELNYEKLKVFMEKVEDG